MIKWQKKKSIVFPISVTQNNGYNVQSSNVQQTNGPPENDPVALLCGCLAGLLNNNQNQGGRMDDDDGGGRAPLQQQIITTSASGKRMFVFYFYLFVVLFRFVYESFWALIVAM